MMDDTKTLIVSLCIGLIVHPIIVWCTWNWVLVGLMLAPEITLLQSLGLCLMCAALFKTRSVRLLE